MSYSITVEWKRDQLYHCLDALRASLGSFANGAPPIHISIASFLQITDACLPSLKHTLRSVCLKCSTHDLVFDRMPDEPFGKKCVAVPVNLCGELQRIQDEVRAFCIGWNVRLVHQNYKPHVTISSGKGNTKGIHEYVRMYLRSWTKQRGNTLRARALGLDLWKHAAGGRRELVENFPFQTFCVCKICDRARRMAIHGCSCRICVRSMALQLQIAG
ncbi:hypothetical protein DFH08DRAFT_832096 [Mycena albidolilacea]|uniref:Uncharacterized protein n=1 Tax=Mycena albidolilacea TaxID=1033008 RepID=A0AAD7F739_9AGAR|nr:hypothetical protein DFH08DRAFT_832096 [Mycena albidolilacea]